jgi:hypothetical protein
VNPAAPPGRAQEDRRDRPRETLVAVADDEAHARQPTCSGAAQEGGPERARLAVADGGPRTSRSPRSVTPVATTIALATTDGPSWAFTDVASRKTYGKRTWSSRRSRNVATTASSSPQIRDTSLLLIPASIPSAATRSSTLRVLTPWTYASMTTAQSARSIRRRGSSRAGKVRILPRQPTFTNRRRPAPPNGGRSMLGGRTRAVPWRRIRGHVDAR